MTQDGGTQAPPERLSDLLSGDMPWWGITIRGAAMGSADVVPGVSGGTMALLLGVYERFVGALSNINGALIKGVLAWVLSGFKAEKKGAAFSAIRASDLAFLVCLGIGVVGAVGVMSQVIPPLMKAYPAHMNGLFFGMILASVMVPFRMMKTRGIQHLVIFGVFTAFAFWFSGLQALNVEFGLVGLFFCGSIAICAMMLPGVSGAFLLLILGQYTVVLAAGKAAAKLQPAALLTLVVFALGCGFGLISFSRVLKWLLNKFHSGTLAALCGLMVGSLQKVWPYKDLTKVVKVGKKVVSAGENVLPTNPNYSGDVFVVAGLMVVGFAVVVVLEMMGGKKDKAH